MTFRNHRHPWPVIGAVLGCLLLTVWMKWRWHQWMTGNPLLLLSVMLELIGVQFISLGLLGELLTRTYFERQGKTSYTVRTTVNLHDDSQRRAA